MRVIKKKIKKPLLLAILAAALVLVSVAAILIDTLLVVSEPEQQKTAPPEIIEGLEDIYNGMAVAYSHIAEENISSVRVIGDNEYYLTRTLLEGESVKEGELIPFKLAYYDVSGRLVPYRPDIADADQTFEYEDIYSIEQNDTFGKIPKITYLCSAIGNTYFQERIALSADAAVREQELGAFGLSEADKPIRVEFIYKDKDGAEKHHTLEIGDKNVNGLGYYFRADGRDYVYSGMSNYMDYALLDFADYISPVLTAAGLAQDTAFEPYLTTDYKQWKNTVYDKEGTAVLPGSEVITSAITYTTSVNDKRYQDGYITDPERSVAFDLADFADTEQYSFVAKLLSGKAVGALDSPVYITLPTYAKLVELNEGKSAEYKYNVTKIESVIYADGTESIPLGQTVGSEPARLKVSYTATLDGKAVSDYIMHAVIDLDSTALASAEESLRAAKVGEELQTPIEISVVYGEDNSEIRDVKYRITEIISVVDSDNHELSEVKVGATVVCRCRLVVDGKEIDEDVTRTLDIKADMEEGEAKKLAAALMGKKQGKIDITVDAYRANCEVFADFISYTVVGIKYFVTSEMIVSFKFQQASERDKYYGESLYINTMEDKNKLYALNTSACEAVVRVFGGLQVNASASEGLKGIQTVAVGITPEIMDKYGLYANTVYFELPRGISNIVYSDDSNKGIDTLDDYTYYSTLGFNLYISDADEVDGTRYIASDLYDIVAKVSGDDFGFLELSFADFYARRSMIMTAVSDIDNITLEFFMDDVYGKYSNEIIHQQRYPYNGKLYTAENLPEEAKGTVMVYDWFTVAVTHSGDKMMDTAFARYLSENSLTGANLWDFYGKNERLGMDTLGTANFKEFAETLFYTPYSGTLSAEEQASDGVLLMRMSVRLYEGYSSSDYVYEYYRISDGQVMVRLCLEDRNTGERSEAVSDFYISTFSFKKIVNCYLGILNRQNIDGDIPYVD